MVLGALAAIARLLLVRFRDGTRLLSGPAWALTSVLFCSYWLPELLSAIDAVDQGRAIREALVDLRYLPFLWLAAAAVAEAQGRRTTLGGLAAIVAVRSAARRVGQEGGRTCRSRWWTSHTKKNQ